MRRDLQYQAGGQTFDGLLFEPDVQPHAAVLVLHGAGGPAEHDRATARKLTALGYAAYVPDVFGQVFTDGKQGAAVIGRLLAAPESLRARLNAALARLSSAMPAGLPAMAVGHCFGGLAALELARSGADLRAAVAVHGGLHTRDPARAGAVRARVLACTGAADPFCTAEHRAGFEAEMSAAGVDWQHHVYGGAMHGFSVPDVAGPAGVAYHEPSARRSWLATVALLDEAAAGVDGPPPEGTNAS